MWGADTLSWGRLSPPPPPIDYVHKDEIGEIVPASSSETSNDQDLLNPLDYYMKKMKA